MCVCVCAGIVTFASPPVCVCGVGWGGWGVGGIATSASPPVCLSTVPPPLNVLILSLSLGRHIKSLAQCFPPAITVSYDFML